MKVVTWGFMAKQSWSLEECNAYYAQRSTLMLERVAVAMERQAKAMEQATRIAVDLRGQETEKRRTAEAAVELMVQRDDVCGLFGEAGCLKLSDFQARLGRLRIHIYDQTLRDAIGMTDYLVLAPAGSGYRVWRAEEYGQQQQAAG